ncbi:MAG: hypothetical protein H2069_04720 [Legionella sp.]|nr:hypothetical protein [Legionella sp.]
MKCIYKAAAGQIKLTSIVNHTLTSRQGMTMTTSDPMNPHDKNQPSKVPSNQEKLKQSKRRDQTLEDSFPASDPPPTNPSFHSDYR